MQPKLSIITINFNNKAGLIKTTQSVFEQTFTDYEYLLIDGGSTDGSKEYIELHKGKFSYAVSEPDKGIYNAMNKGILQAKGEYLQFLNSGDWLADSSVLEKVFDKLPDCDMVYGNMLKVIPGGKTVNDKGPPGGNISFQTFYTWNINHSPSFIKAVLFTKYGLYDEQLKIASDWKFFLIAFGLNSSYILYKNIEVAYFDMTGISNVQKDLLRAEKKKVLEELVPYPILTDYRNNESDIVRTGIINRHFVTARLYRLQQILMVRLSNLLSTFNSRG
jgi:glycosyltransferase involved in cell wall biosynthesis